MASLVRGQQNACTPEAPASPAAMEWALPADILLEIVARSDMGTLVRCAALCKLLRHDFLSPSFIRRVTHHGTIVPSCILAYLQTHDDAEAPPPSLSLVHPSTPAGVLFCDDHLSSFISRNPGDLFEKYYPMESRGRLVLLHRCYHHVVGSDSDMCVYDPISGHRTFLSEPPGISNDMGCFLKCVLITAADGIKFRTRVPIGTGRGIKFRTFASSTGTWGPVTTHDNFFLQRWLGTGPDATTVVLHGGVIHWLGRHGGEILTYDVCMEKPGTIGLPSPISSYKARRRFHLGSYSSRDGHMLLKLVVNVGCTISVWHQLSGGGWTLETVIDVEKKLWSLDPRVLPHWYLHVWLRPLGERRGVVLMQISLPWHGPLNGACDFLAVLDLETKEIHILQRLALSSMLLEIDMPSRLRAMKIFS
ncbi:hypothetical protein VPH35_003952 [Triticum aestivum]